MNKISLRIKKNNLNTKAEKIMETLYIQKIYQALNAVQHTHHTDAISREADIEKYKPVNAEA
jgi:hypothetical protein